MKHLLVPFTEPITGLKFMLRDGTSDREVIREAIEDNAYKIKPDTSTGVVLDIGANIGAFSLLAAQWFPHKRIVCYEPEPDNRACLARNVELNGLGKRITIHGQAVAGDRGAQIITRQQGNSRIDSTPQDVSQSSPSAERIECYSVTLTDVLIDNGIDSCWMLKLDAEGSEFEILKYPSTVKHIERIAMETHWFTEERWQTFINRLSLTHVVTIEPGYIFATAKI